MRQVLVGLLVGWLIAATAMATVILVSVWRTRREQREQATRLALLRRIVKPSGGSDHAA